MSRYGTIRPDWDYGRRYIIIMVVDGHLAPGEDMTSEGEGMVE